MYKISWSYFEWVWSHRADVRFLETASYISSMENIFQKVSNFKFLNLHSERLSPKWNERYNSDKIFLEVAWYKVQRAATYKKSSTSNMFCALHIVLCWSIFVLRFMKVPWKVSDLHVQRGQTHIKKSTTFYLKGHKSTITQSKVK